MSFQALFKCTTCHKNIYKFVVIIIMYGLLHYTVGLQMLGIERVSRTFSWSIQRLELHTSYSQELQHPTFSDMINSSSS